MLAKDMTIGHRYVTQKGTKFKVLAQEPDGSFKVYVMADESTRIVPEDYEVTSVKELMGRLPDDELQRFISYIKNRYSIGLNETVRYLSFLKDGVRFQLHYIAQRIVVRNPIDGYKPDGKWKNGYVAYKINTLKEFLLK